MANDSFGGLASNGATPGNFATALPQELLIRQEVNLGIVREMVPPQNHIGLSLLAPWLEVPTDDVVMDYVRGSASGLAPAVAQDAESETFQDSEDYSGQIRASLIDWRHRSEYTASDIMTYREAKELIEATAGRNGKMFPLTTRSVVEGFQRKLDRDGAKRRLWLDNRIEWLITQAISTGQINYNDGKIKFNVNYGRPANQHQEAPAGGADYSSDTHDPINDAIGVKEFMFEEQHVNIKRAICSRKYAQSIWKSSKFRPRTGFPNSDNVDPKYILDNWGPQAAIEIYKREAEIDLIVAADNVYRLRDYKTGVITTHRYLPQDEIIYLPDDADIAAFDDSEIGFGKTLTSPHPMGNWEPGFYTWEAERTDPWNYIVGTGVKAFPVFPHMELTYTEKVTL